MRPAIPHPRFRRSMVGVLLGALMFSLPAFACPVCDTEIGRQVREGIFDAEFGRNAARVLLPFPIFLGIGAALYYGLGPRRRPPGRG